MAMDFMSEWVVVCCMCRLKGRFKTLYDRCKKLSRISCYDRTFMLQSRFFRTVRSTGYFPY